MTIRNTKLGYTDFHYGEGIEAEDLNDTFDEIVRVVDNGN